ncbi:hypothetical protein QKA_3464 [Clostridioides difficile DA00165]|nr:hypothetical protein QKA_3464 [Clostridioides difficile DA00165]
MYWWWSRNINGGFTIGGNMNKIVSIDEALSHVKDGDTIMANGFN